jgi:transglutaminase-like putative cysteine protease
MTRQRDLGTRGDGRYRVIDQHRIVANLVRNFYPYEAVVDRSRATAEAERLLERWIAAGLPVRMDRGVRKLDPFEACNFALQAWIDDQDPVWFSHQVASSRRMIREVREQATPSTRFAVTFRREFNLRPLASATHVRLRLPLPIDSASVESTRIEPVARLATTSLVAAGRLEVRFPMPYPALESLWVEATSMVSGGVVGIALNEDTACDGYDVSSADYRLYTRRDEGLIRVTAAVEQLGDQIAPANAPPTQMIKRIWDYFTTRMRIGFIHYDELDADDPLGTLIARAWCDCHTGSALFAALARSRGIPARIVSGAVVYPIAPSQHSWLEVLLPPHGWLPIDIFGGLLAARSLVDPEWSNCFLGYVDPRLVTQRLPQIFVGAPGVKLSREWYLLQSLTEGGADWTLGSLDQPGRADWALCDELRVSSRAGPEPSKLPSGTAG